MRLTILRHGRTSAQDNKWYAGATDLPLTEDGIAALTALKARGLYPAAGQAFTSGMLRAEQTLAILYGEVPHTAIPDLAECRFGRFELHTHEELTGDADYEKWVWDHTGTVRCPGGESRVDFEARVAQGWEALLRMWTRDAVLITHGGVIATLMAALFPGERDFYGWQPGCGLGHTLERAADGTFTHCNIGMED